MKEKKSPKEASDHDTICKMESDNMDTENAWILNDQSYVCIAQQREGEEAEGLVKISKEEFNQLVDWYLKPQDLIE